MQLISQDLLFWTFSTIAQSFIAFISLLGMVAIYKLQAINNDRDRLAMRIKEILNNLNFDEGLRSHYTTDAIINIFFESIGRHLNTEFAYLEGINKSLVSKKKNLTMNLNLFLQSTIILISFSLLALVLTPLLKENILGLIFILLSLFLSSRSIYLGTKLISKNIINEPEIKYLNNLKVKLRGLIKGDQIDIYLFKQNQFIQDCYIVNNDQENEELEVIEINILPPAPNRKIQYYEIVKFDFKKKKNKERNIYD